MMKNFNTIFLAGALLLSACSLDKQPLNGPASGTFPASESEALAGTYAAYKGLALMSAQTNYFPYCNQDCATDIFGYRPGASNFQKQLASTLTPNHALVEKEYKYVYKVAGRCHQVLDKIDNLKDQCSEQTINCYKAELLCIRAHQYDQCMQFYGGIPFIDHCLDLKDNAYGRNTIKQCADSMLLYDLKDELLECLPLSWGTAIGTTRINRGAAFALKARIALNWGYLDIAVDASKKALAYADAAGYGLMPINAESWKLWKENNGYIPHDKGEMDVSDIFGLQGQNCKEILWAIQRNLIYEEDLQKAISYASPRTNNGVAWLGPTQSMMDTYQCFSTGKSILETPTYDPNNPWVDRDPRLAITATLPGTRLMGIQYEMNPTITKVMDYVQGTLIQNMDADPKANKVEYAAFHPKGPGSFLIRKFSDPGYYGLVNEPDVLNTILIRYAELLLLEAEANIEAVAANKGGNLSVALADINKLRARYEMPAVPSTNDVAVLRSALRYERKVELIGEGFRWFDLRRWTDDGLLYNEGVIRTGVESVAVKAINGPQWMPRLPKENEPQNPTFYISNAKPAIDANWTVTYDGQTTWKEGDTFNLTGCDVNMVFSMGRDLLWPIPETEMLTNPKITPKDQNPGY